MGKEILEIPMVKQATVDITHIIIFGCVIVFAFFLYILVKKNFSQMAYLRLLGWFIKRKQMFRVGGIFEYDGVEWYLDNLNTYDIKFKEVIERDSNMIILSTKQKIIPYNIFLKNRTWISHFGL